MNNNKMNRPNNSFQQYPQNNGYYMPPVNKQKVKPPLLQKGWFIILMLMSVTPLGLFLMWYYKEWKLPIKIIISIYAVIYFTVLVMGISMS